MLGRVLTLSWKKFLSYRNQSVDLLCNSSLEICKTLPFHFAALSNSASLKYLPWDNLFKFWGSLTSREKFHIELSPEILKDMKSKRKLRGINDFFLFKTINKQFWFQNWFVIRATTNISLWSFSNFIWRYSKDLGYLVFYIASLFVWVFQKNLYQTKFTNANS